MSVLIKGMEMPKDEEMLCINIYPDGKVCINLDLDCKQIATAVHVPPHGDLIDQDAYRDEFMDGVYDLCNDDPDNCRANSIIDLFDSAPTVIPADKEGET